MPLAIMLILSFSMNKACQEILRAIALGAGPGRLHDNLLEKKNRIRFAGGSRMICMMQGSPATQK